MLRRYRKPHHPECIICRATKRSKGRHDSCTIRSYVPLCTYKKLKVIYRQDDSLVCFKKVESNAKAIKMRSIWKSKGCKHVAYLSLQEFYISTLERVSYFRIRYDYVSSSTACAGGLTLLNQA
jgi:hypothetical protein